MAFREVAMFEVRELLRHWLAGESQRTIAVKTDVDKDTVGRYVAAAVASGVVRDGGDAQLSDEVLAQVVERVRPLRTNGHGAARQMLERHRERIGKWLEDGLTITKVHDLLSREGVSVPVRTLERFCLEHFGPRRGRERTVRVADGEPAPPSRRRRSSRHRSSHTTFPTTPAPRCTATTTSR